MFGGIGESQIAAQSLPFTSFSQARHDSDPPQKKTASDVPIACAFQNARVLRIRFFESLFVCPHPPTTGY